MTKRWSCFLLTVTALLVALPEGNELPAFRPLRGAFFVVTKNHYAEGFTPNGDTARIGDLILIGFLDRKQPGGGVRAVKDPNQASNYYEKTYFQAGRRFTLFRAGAPAGSARIEKVVPLQCDSSAALATVEGKLVLGEHDFAIATDAPVISHGNWQQQSSSDEKRILNDWAHSYFRQRQRQGEFKVVRSLETAIDAGGQKRLIAELSLESKVELRDVFVIGHLTDGRYIPELIRDHHTDDVEDAKDFEPESFVDQIDVDGDKIDEIIVEQTGYESEQFLVYKWSGKTWQRVWTGGQGGC